MAFPFCSGLCNASLVGLWVSNNQSDIKVPEAPSVTQLLFDD